MIDITQITLIPYTDMTNGWDTLDILKKYNGKFWAHKVKNMCKVTYVTSERLLEFLDHKCNIACVKAII